MRWMYFFVLVVFLFPLAAATVSLDNSSIDGEYFDESSLTGWVNLSFQNEDIDLELVSKFDDVVKDKIRVVDFLENNSLSFTCNPIDCENNYVASGGEASKSVSLADDKKIYGFKLSGNGIDISDFSFDLESSAGSSCENQLAVDLLDDGVVDWINDQYVFESCGEKIGSSCYGSEFNIEVVVSQAPYCEKIEIPVSPSIKVNTGIKKTGGSYSFGDLKAYLYDTHKKLGECDLSNPGSGGSLCFIEYAVNKKDDYFVCVSLREGFESENYRIPANTLKACGFQGDPVVLPQLTTSYDIRVTPQKYAPVGSLSFDEVVFSNQNDVDLKSYLEEYLQEKYSSNCVEGCVIPVSFSGGEEISQIVTLDNLDIQYDILGGSGLSEDKFYEISETPAKFSTDELNFDFEKMEFKIPSLGGDYLFSLYGGVSKILDKSISVAYSVEQPISDLGQIYPSEVAIAYPTTFVVFTNPSLDILGASFEWDFGDGSGKVITNTNRVNHTYVVSGDYSLNVSLVGTSVKNSFDIRADVPKKAINDTLSEYNERIARIESQLSLFPESYQGVFDDVIVLDDVKEAVSGFESDYELYLEDEDTLDSDYVELITQILTYEVPISIQQSKVTNSDFIFDIDLISLDDVYTLFGDDDWENEEATKREIVKWFLEDIDGEVKHSVWTIYYPKKQEDVLTEFSVEISPSSGLDYSGYFVIDDSEDYLLFDGEYEFADGNNGETGIHIDFSGESSVIFAKQGVSGLFDDLTFYLVPEMSVVGVDNQDEDGEGGGGGMGWLIFFGAVVLLLIVFFVGYLFLEKWYENNYEKFLFKNRADLYNLMNFIRNARRKRLSDKEIVKNLRKTKWKKEQVDYALKKFEGKKIEMLKLPFFRGRKKKGLRKRRRL